MTRWCSSCSIRSSFALAFHHARNRNPRPTRQHFSNFGVGHFLTQQTRRLPSSCVQLPVAFPVPDCHLRFKSAPGPPHGEPVRIAIFACSSSACSWSAYQKAMPSLLSTLLDLEYHLVRSFFIEAYSRRFFLASSSSFINACCSSLSWMIRQSSSVEFFWF